MAAPGGILALGAAAAWGGGDFAGGMGVRKTGGTTTAALWFLILAHGASLVILAGLLAASGWPTAWGVAALWALGSGVAAALALTAFYMALARGEMGVSAALSGILAAAIPALASTVLEGAPTALRVVGFVLAAVAIWTIAAGDAKPAERSTFWLAMAGGVGFGVYFVALRMANPLGVVAPMMLARVASVTTCVVLVVVMTLGGNRAGAEGRGGFAEVWRVWPWALAVAAMDTGGNLLFVAATRAGRLDVAAVLASLYPAGTILLAAWRLHEKPSRRQLGGMALALAAVVMITV
ncbi:MAG: EamA family transporter [Bryocella sp.]